MAKNFYAVKRGFDKNQNQEIKDLIFINWYEVAPLVIGYENARYKGFNTEEEAETWLKVVDKTDAEKAEKRATKQSNQIKKESNIEENNDNHFLPFDILLNKVVKELIDIGYDKEHIIGKLTNDVVITVNHITKEV
jgi:viroplasmin and RNaseH domain-containing protein